MVSPSSAELSLSFEGDALNDGVIDVRDLAPSLIALGEVFTQANDLLNERQASIQLGIRATQRGSFEVQLVLSQVAVATAGFIAVGNIQSAAALTQLILGGDVSLLGLLKRLKGQKPTRVTEQSDGVHLVADRLEIFVPTEAYRLYRQPSMLRGAAGIIEPLLRGAVDRLVLRQAGREIDSVDQTEARYLRISGGDSEVLNEYIIPSAVLRLVSPRFAADKWQLNDGSNTKWYSMEDRRFQREIDQGRPFRNGDMIVGRVRVTQFRDDENKLSQAQAIELVLEHRQTLDQIGDGSGQLQMFDPNDN
jgi:hypothetical protein